CQVCPTGSFSDTFDADLCRPHTSCESLRRVVAVPGTSGRDSVCGDCLSGEHGFATMYGTRHLVYLSFFYLLCSVFSASLKRQIRTVGKGPSGGGGAPVNGTVVRTAEEKTAEYAVFALVPVFCIMGLLGILICNILKKKGYRCSTDKEGGDEETPTPQKEGHE
ncbi:unnamed protein product, partial [Tetraodon nigroviridis]